MAGCQELAEIGRVTGTELVGDDRLLTALVAGCHVENAAKVAGLSERTVYRRLADRDFRGKLNQARGALRESILARLADAGNDAISKLWELMGSEDENIQLKAAKAVLEALAKLQSSAPKETQEQQLLGQVGVYLPDDGRNPEITQRIEQSGGQLRL